MFAVKEVTQDLLNRLFASNVIPRVQLSRWERFPDGFSETELAEIRQIVDAEVTVAGVDIYRYSRFPTETQIFIPHLYELIYNEAWHLIRQNYSYLFQEYGDLLTQDSSEQVDYRGHFIDTGDGGYQILPTPIHGLIFILTFATVLRLYNSDRFMRRLHAKIGNVEVRYAMTQDEVYKFRNGFYGAGIINNARILSRDRLNRFLIDQNTHDWFLRSTLGIENLMVVTLEQLQELEEFAHYSKERILSGNNALIPARDIFRSAEGFKSIDIQKIGEVHQKQTPLQVHNLHIQALIEYQNLFDQKTIVTVSLGNLNTTGIEDGEA